MTDTQTDAPQNPSSKRRWLYGFNATVLVLIALVIVGFIGYLTTPPRLNKHWDWTGSGLYSLSGSTKNLLAEATSKGQKYELISLFPPATTTEEERQRQQVTDVLEEYARASSAIKVSDASELTQEEIERQIRALYSAELKPYQETVGAFDKLAEDLKKFFTDEAANIGAVAQKPGTPSQTVEEATVLQGSMSYGIPKQITAIQSEVRRLTDSTSPDMSAAVERIKSFTEPMTDNLKKFSDPKGLRAELSPAMAAYFASAEKRYADILGQVSAYKEQIDKLQPLKVTEVLGALKRNTIVVVGPTTAKVVSSSDIFQYQPAAREGQEPNVQFNGEQAISSAILSLARPEKVKVVFVSSSPSHPSTGQFSEITRELEGKNFEVMDWSPPGPPTGGAPPEINPPAEGKGVVWVVMPPDAPNMQMMRMGMPPPNPGPVLEAARKHLAAGGQAMFLAEAAGEMAMMMGQGSAYPYEELLKDYGVHVQAKYTVVQQIEGRHPVTGQLLRMTNPAVPITRYPNHPITSSLQSLETVFAPLRSQGGGMVGVPTVVSVAKTLPQGVEAAVFLETPKSADFWGESSPSQDAVFNKETDIAAPVPLAVAAVRNKGQGDKEQRVVAIGSSVFASNPFLQESSTLLVGNRIVEVPSYPGNSELFTNSVLWLAGYENMIAVSAKTNAALRIADISPGKLLAIRLIFFYLGLPIAALILGGVVWFVRRK